MKWYRLILPFAFAVATGCGRRYTVRLGVDFEWSDRSWTHNVFRVYELVFGRRDGMRPELSAGVDRGKAWQQPHTFEAACGLAETLIRNWFTHALPRVSIIRRPALVAPGVGVLFPSIYSFAIALDTVATGPNINAATITWTHTCTGSNLLLLLGAMGRSDLGQISASYNSVSATKQGTQQAQGGIYRSALLTLVGPATGANTASITFSGTSNDPFGTSISYSGVSQSGFPDSQAENFGSGASSMTATTTVVGSNCWLICWFVNDQANNVAGTGTTLRGTATNRNFGDSNGVVGTGSQSLADSWGVNANFSWNIVSVAAVASAASAPKSIISDEILFN